MKKLVSIALSLVLMLTLVGCNSSNDSTTTEETKVTVTHDLGETEVTTNPKKIAVFDLGILDIFDNLGIEVGAVPDASFPDYLSKYSESTYTKVGSMKEVDFDALSDYAPDLIIISARLSDSYEELSEIAPTVYFAMPGATYFDTLTTNVEILSKIFPSQSDALTKGLETIKNDAATLEEKAKDSGLNALTLMANDGSLSVFGAGSRYGVIYDGFGFVESDTTVEASTHGQEASFEYISEINPDVIFVIDRSAAIGSEGDSGASTLLDNDLVNATTAATNEKIVYLSSDVWYLVNGGFTATAQMISEVATALD